MPRSDDPGRLARLIDTRGKLATAVANCESPRDLPALSREYRMTLAELDALSPREEVDVVDQLAARRGAKDPRRTTGSA